MVSQAAVLSAWLSSAFSVPGLQPKTRALVEWRGSQGLGGCGWWRFECGDGWLLVAYFIMVWVPGFPSGVPRGDVLCRGMAPSSFHSR